MFQGMAHSQKQTIEIRAPKLTINYCSCLLACILVAHCRSFSYY